jgi:hypothetical protein
MKFVRDEALKLLRVKRSYLRTSHIAQPATITPPTNITKQYKP